MNQFGWVNWEKHWFECSVSIFSRKFKFPEKFEKIHVIQVHIYKQSGKVSINLDGWIERNINFNVQFHLARPLTPKKNCRGVTPNCWRLFLADRPPGVENLLWQMTWDELCSMRHTGANFWVGNHAKSEEMLDFDNKKRLEKARFIIYL